MAQATARQQYEEAQRLYKEGQHVAALNILDNLLTAFPDDKSLVNAKATVSRTLGIPNSHVTPQNKPTGHDAKSDLPITSESPQEQFDRGCRYYADDGGGCKSLQKAADLFRKAAERGHGKAQYNLGVCYDKGEGVKQDREQAVIWFTKAAEQGDKDAQHNLGVCYENGDGTSQDYQQAAIWYRKAAEQGHALAQYNLGVCYYNGQGVEEDQEQAVIWFGKAAVQGDAKAQHNLGLCYYNGKGVEQDRWQAAIWFHKAASQGCTGAQKSLDLCRANNEDAPQAVVWFRRFVSNPIVTTWRTLCESTGQVAAPRISQRTASNAYGSSARQETVSEHSPEVAPDLVGIRGWLVFPAIWLVLGSISEFVWLIIGLMLYSQVAAAGYGGLYALEFLVGVGLLTFRIYAGKRFFEKKRAAPSIIIALLSAGVVCSFLLLVLNLGLGAEGLALENGKWLLKTVVSAAIWIPYFRVSQRVRATFVN